MKPVHVAILVVAGAIGGAVVMQVWQRARVAAPAPAAVAQVKEPAQPAAPAAEQQPAAQPATPTPAAAAAPEVSAPASAAPAAEPAPLKEEPLPVRKRVPPHRARPVVAARSEPPRQERPAPVPAPVEAPKETAPAAEPAAQAAAESAAPPPAVADSPARPEPEHTTPPPLPPPEPNRVTLNAGLLIPVRLVDGLSTERNKPGDPFIGTLDKELVADGFVIAERGARVEGRVVSSDPGGKTRGVAALAIELTRLHTSDGQNIAIQTESFERRAEPNHQADVAKIGGGAAVGAIIGAIAGGGKGAAIGAGAGGAAGAGGVLLTRGKPATLPSETRLSLRLRAPVTITEKRYQ